MKRRSANARETAPGACSSGLAPGRVAAQTASAAATTPTAANETPMPTASRHGAEHGAEDGAEDSGAERGPDQLATALARGRDREPGESAGPGGRAREALDEPREAERPGPFRGGEGEAGDGEQDEAGDDRALRPAARRCEPAGDPAEQRAGAEGGRRAARRRSSRARTRPRSRESAARAPRTASRPRTRPRRREQEAGASIRRYRRPDGLESRGSPEASLQGSWREPGPLPRPVSRLRPNKFSEPVALSSAPPTDVSASAYSSSGGASTYSRSVLAARGNLGRLGWWSRGRKTESSQIAVFSS